MNPSFPIIRRATKKVIITSFVFLLLKNILLNLKILFIESNSLKLETDEELSRILKNFTPTLKKRSNENIKHRNNNGFTKSNALKLRFFT